EKKTQAEFLCVVTSQSGRYDRAESIVGLAFGVAGMLLSQSIGSILLAPGPGSWITPGTVGSGWLLVGLVVGFVVGNTVATFWPRLARPLVPAREIAQEVERSAAYVFSLHKVSHTARGVGVLLYLSLLERRVVVLADRAAFEVLGQAGVDSLRDLAIEKLKAGERVETLTATVGRAAEMLAERFPCPDDDVDELPNHLVVIHPRP
ncbi:MAG: hypothetical protein KC910_12995, partial [Candidatus Eremiobacteraeota bacterium]|nr:hypothetical protein [Candidatus Eremiobacteraeota bacterium]